METKRLHNWLWVLLSQAWLGEADIQFQGIESTPHLFSTLPQSHSSKSAEIGSGVADTKLGSLKIFCLSCFVSFFTSDIHFAKQKSKTSGGFPQRQVLRFAKAIA